ncbi:MAG: hypothetical protein HYY13_13245 [Nitrospirae bacterium]|nr:hypothetical protein [Nitrospirota bacterium]
MLALKHGDAWDFKVVGPKSDRLVWGDSWIDFTTRGLAFVVYLSVGLPGPPYSHKLHLRRVDPTAFDIGEELPNPFYMDHPSIAVDPTVADADYLYLVGHSEEGLTGTILVESHDGGESWDTAVPFPSELGGLGAVVASGGGRTVVAGLGEGVGVSSYDSDANRFEAATILDTNVPFSCEQQIYPVPSLAVAETGRLAGTAYAVWAGEGRRFTEADIRLSISRDGLTWSPPVRVNDDPFPDVIQYFPSVSTRPDGTALVTWMDGRDAPPGTLRIYAAVVDENGRVGPNVPVTRCPGFFETYPERTLGDYFVFDASQGPVDLLFPRIHEPGGYSDVYYLGWQTGEIQQSQ